MQDQSKTPRRGRPKSAVSESPEGSSPVLALDRGLRALVFIAENGGATLTEISIGTETPPATCHRILATLELRGMAKFDDKAGKWVVGPQAFLVGQTYRQRYDLVDLATPLMQELATKTGETANLAIEDQGELVYLAQVESENPIRASLKNGGGNHFNTSGVGKAILAFMTSRKLEAMLPNIELRKKTHKSITDLAQFKAELAQIRTQGWALDDEERFIGMRCIAAPIFDLTGNVVAGVSISGPSARFPYEELGRMADDVVAAARDISTQICTFEA